MCRSTESRPALRPGDSLLLPLDQRKDRPGAREAEPVRSRPGRETGALTAAGGLYAGLKRQRDLFPGGAGTIWNAVTMERRPVGRHRLNLFGGELRRL